MGFGRPATTIYALPHAVVQRCETTEVPKEVLSEVIGMQVRNGWIV